MSVDRDHVSAAAAINHAVSLTIDRIDSVGTVRAEKFVSVRPGVGSRYPPPRRDGRRWRRVAQQLRSDSEQPLTFMDDRRDLGELILQHLEPLLDLSDGG